MIVWTDDAIEAADEAFHTHHDVEDSFEFWRLVLDAAIKAQKEVHLDVYAYHAPSYARGRADALEEAAKIADEQTEEPDSKFPSDTARKIAAAIRALKEK